MKHLDLFSGIGGFALAARNVGWQTVGFCEIDPWCRKVLAKHWPGVPIYDDIKTITAYSAGYGCGQRWAWGVVADGEDGSPEKSPKVGPVDIITGGFPCQDISYAGKGAGIDGERSGLWTELARIIGEVRPRYAVLENVAALLSRGLDRVAGDLAEIGYDCEWHCIPASAVGAPHRRDRIWIIAHPQHTDADDAGSHRTEMHLNGGAELRDEQISEPRPIREDVADTDEPRSQGYGRLLKRACERAFRENSGAEQGIWFAEPDVGRVAHGIPRRVDRLRGLGNAIVPQVAELIFKAISHRIPECPDRKAAKTG